MLALKTPQRQAEKIRKELIGMRLYGTRYKPKKEGKHIFFPLLKKHPSLLKYKNTAYAEKEMEEAHKKRRYKEELENAFGQAGHKEMPRSYDIIGDIIIIGEYDMAEKKKKAFADALLRSSKNIKTILKKEGQHEGEFRTQKLSYLAGENKKETICKENNTRIKLDVEKVYFSPRLSTERKRIYRQINPGEEVLVMFSGAAPYPCVISKNTSAKEIIGIEKNPAGHRYGIENTKLNKLKNITLFCGDVRKVVPMLGRKFNRILMPLPKGAEDFLDLALSVSKKGSTIHFYDFEHGNEIRRGEEKVRRACEKGNRKFRVLRTVKCGQYSPGKYRICVDFVVF